MSSSALREMKEDRLANSAVTAFLGSLLVGQSWEWWESSPATGKLFTLTVPDYSGLVILTMISGLFVLSLFLASASMITPLQRWGLRAARSASPIMLPVVSTSFVISWLSSSLELPFDQWWSSVLFVGGFLMFVFIGFRHAVTSFFRFLGRRLGRATVSELSDDIEFRDSSDGEAKKTPYRTFPLERLSSLRSRCRMREYRGFWITASMIAALIGIALTVVLWDWLADNESASATIRNVGLVIAGSVALPLAIWRALVADKQATAAQQQADSARRSMLNDRYQRGAEMLGSEALSVRTGGIYTLQNLAEENPDYYHVQVMRLFCAFVCHPTNDDEIEFYAQNDEERDEQTLRADVQDIMQAIGSRNPESISLERMGRFRLYLRGADLVRLRVRDANLSGAWLTKADLSGVKFWGANLSKAKLHDANLSGADLCGVDANSSVYKEPVCGLTQAQLDEAWADSDNPPKLRGVLDAETGKKLIWRRRN